VRGWGYYSPILTKVSIARGINLASEWRTGAHQREVASASLRRAVATLSRVSRCTSKPGGGDLADLGVMNSWAGGAGNLHGISSVTPAEKGNFVLVASASPLDSTILDTYAAAGLAPALTPSRARPRLAHLRQSRPVMHAGRLTERLWRPSGFTKSRPHRQSDPPAPPTTFVWEAAAAAPGVWRDR